MRQDSRLKKLERHPETLFKQELQRLQEQETKPLEEVIAAIWNAPPTQEARLLREVTDAQLLRMVLQTSLTPEQREHAEELLETLHSLRQEARRNVELILQPPPSPAKLAAEEQTVASLLTTFGLCPKRELTEAEREGYACL